MSKNNVGVLDWPALPPELNFIENVQGWPAQKNYAKGKQFEDERDLTVTVKAAFETIPKSYL